MSIPSDKRPLTHDEIIRLATERGYTHHSTEMVHMVYHFVHERCPEINLSVWSEDETFELMIVHGLLQTRTNKLGSFSNRVHFNKFEKMIFNAYLVLV